MPRKDGRPRVATPVVRDPLPYRNTVAPVRYVDAERAAYFTGQPTPGDLWVFDPRPGYIQDEEQYT